MHTILVHTPKGGAGRTVVSAALAAGFLDLGLNVMLGKVQYRCPPEDALLGPWVERIRDLGFENGQLGYLTLLPSTVALDTLVSTAERGYDVAIIDTPAVLEPHFHDLLGQADLIVCPATCAMAAAAAVEFVATYELWDRAVGLSTGFTRAKQNTVTRHAFGGISVLQSDLPSSPEIGSLITIGEFKGHARSLTCGWGKPGYAAYRSAQRSARQVQLLTSEVFWRLNDKKLVPWQADDAEIAQKARMAARVITAPISQRALYSDKSKSGSSRAEQ